MTEFIDEASDVSAAESVAEGASFHAIVTGGAEGAIMGTMEVMDVEEEVVDCARAAGARARRVEVMVE